MKILKRITKVVLIAIGFFIALPEAFIVVPIFYIITGNFYKNPIFIRALYWDVEK